MSEPQRGPVILVPKAVAQPSSTIPVVVASAVYKPLEQPTVAATCGRRRISSPVACQCWQGSPLSVMPSPRLREAITSRPQSATMQGRPVRRALPARVSYTRCSASASAASPSSSGTAAAKDQPPPAAVAIPVSPARLAASLQGTSLSPWLAASMAAGSGERRRGEASAIPALAARPRPRSSSSPITSPSRPQAAAASPARPHSARAAPRQHHANDRRHLLAAAAGDTSAATCRPAVTQRDLRATPLDFGGVGGGAAFLNQLDSLAERPPGLGGMCEGLGLGLATKQIAPHARSGAPSRGRPASALPLHRPQPPRPATCSPELPVEKLRVGIVRHQGGKGTAQTVRIPARVPLEPELQKMHRAPARPRSARNMRAAHVELEIFPAEVGPWARRPSSLSSELESLEERVHEYRSRR